MEKLVLIDGNSLINRAFYAMPLMTTKNGIYTNAVYGFMNMLFKILGEVKPDYLAVAFDVKAPTFRHEFYTEYKGTRKPMAEELRPQLPLLKKILQAMNVCTVEKAGLEADDIIGTIAKSTNVETIIYTGDRDSFQLVDKTTSVYFTKRGITDTDVLNNDNFFEKTELLPYQIIEFKALMGDPSDNIPGVSGIGQKTALSLISKYKDIDNLYKNVNELSGKLKEKIESGKDSAYMSKYLATIKTDCDILTDLTKMVVPKTFSNEVKQIFIDLEFRSFYVKDDIFDKNEISINNTVKSANSVLIKSENDFNVLKNSVDSVFIDDNAIFIYSKENNTEYKILIRENLFDDGVSFTDGINAIKNIFSEGNNLVVYNKKDLRHFLFDNFKIDIKCKIKDVSLMKYLADYQGGNETAKEVIELYGEDKNKPAFALYNISISLEEKLKSENAEKLYFDIELPLSDVLFDMEESGFKVDETALIETGKKYSEFLRDCELKIKKLADEPTLNINSPKQLGDVLFEKLKIGKGKKTKNGYSTQAEILENLEDAHPIIPLILEYRKIQKLQSTYIEGLKAQIDKSTGLIHTSFNQTVTSTGRLSSKEPNLQNIPVRDEEGKLLRKFFVPKSPDRVLVGADYSQIELRLLAAFSNSKTLIKAFSDGVDVHTQTASKVFNVDKEKVTDEMRRKAKAVNFGIIYGISEYGLAKNIKTSPSLAKQYIDSYFKEFPEVKNYMDENVKKAKAKGYAETLYNRRRYIREINSSNYNLRSFGERVALNMPLQGSAADVIKIAMINVSNRLKKEKLKSELILQIHDELIIDALDSEKEQVIKLLKEEMEEAVKLSVRLTVELGVGKTWFETK